MREACSSALDRQRGAIIFVAGARGSGRSALLHELRDSGPRVARTAQRRRWCNHRRQIRPVANSATLARPSVRCGRGCAGSGESRGLPVLGLVGQLVRMSRAAARVCAPESRNSAIPTAILPSALRAAAREKPLICLVDDCDHAPGMWWSELLLGFADELSESLPLVLILAVEGGDHPGAHGDDLADVVCAARTLVARGRASWVPLRRLGVSHLSVLTGQAERVVLNRLKSLCEGSAVSGAHLWDEWREAGVVERDTDLGPWRFAPGQPEASASLSGILAKRVRRAVGGDLAAAHEAWQVLVCASLEGRHFTAEAVAIALDQEPETLTRLLDKGLSATKPSGPCLIECLGQLELDGGPKSRRVTRYRFLSPVFPVVLARHCLTPTERERLSAALARGLETAFGSRRGLVAPRLPTCTRPRETSKRQAIIG